MTWYKEVNQKKCAWQYLFQWLQSWQFVSSIKLFLSVVSTIDPLVPYCTSMYIYVRISVWKIPHACLTSYLLINMSIKWQIFPVYLLDTHNLIYFNAYVNFSYYCVNVFVLVFFRMVIFCLQLSGKKNCSTKLKQLIKKITYLILA